MAYALGVDLGTTYTAAAVATGGRAEVVPLSHRAPQIRSAAYKPLTGPLVFGDPAVRHLVPEPERTATEFKRRIGDPVDIYLGGTPMSALALSKGLLRTVVDAVVRGQGGPPSSLTVACPANWGPHRRELMQQVIELSPGLPAALCTEPEAAGAHFALDGRMAAGDTVAVYDLGGGTFDASVIRRTAEGFTTLGRPYGDELLGGFELDGAVFEHVLNTVGRNAFDPDDDGSLETLARLRADCTEAREALSSELEVSVPVVVGQRRTSVRLTRHEFEGLIRERVEETVDTLERAVTSAGITPADLTAVLLVGGTAQTPLVTEVVSRRLEVPVVLEPQPKLCVALGAALIGAALTDAALTEAARPLAPRAPTAPRPAVATVPDTPARADTPAPAPLATVTRIGSTRTSVPASAGASAVKTGGDARSRLPWYRIASPALLLVALLLSLVGPAADSGGRRWDSDFRVDARPGDTRLQLTFAGIPVLGPVAARDGSFRLDRHRPVLGGPVTAQLNGTDQEEVLRPPPGFELRRLATVQGVLMVLAALFSFAYVESLLRSLRRKRRAVAGPELLGLAAAGAVAGVAIALVGWVVAGRLLDVGTVVVLVGCASAGTGLLALGWDRSRGARA